MLNEILEHQMTRAHALPHEVSAFLYTSWNLAIKIKGEIPYVTSKVVKIGILCKIVEGR